MNNQTNTDQNPIKHFSILHLEDSSVSAQHVGVCLLTGSLFYSSRPAELRTGQRKEQTVYIRRLSVPIQHIFSPDLFI